MGNETFRSSRHSATSGGGGGGGSSSVFRRTNSRRHSKSTSSTGQNYIAEDEVDRQQQLQVQELTPKPQRRMDKIRRSLSFRRKKKSDKKSNNNTTNLSNSTTNNNPTNTTNNANNKPNDSNNSQQTANNNNNNKNNTKNDQQQQQSSNSNNATTTTNTTTTATTTTTTTTNNDSSNTNGPVRPALWIEDEKKVRAGNCSFQVKYLGFQEVSDSRGMHICELAIQKLIDDKDKKKPIKAILYVSGDSLRVVDESNKTLLVDQTIEKVSFCAPDRNHENGFAYICRDGTARRWLCHGFLAIKDTLKGANSGCTGGERLSHAVGCAFSVCLERKQKRERENVSMEVGPNHSFTRLGSFRHASLTERFEDPQMVIPAVEPVPIKRVDNPHAIERPKPSQDAFTRQNSLRGTASLQLPFKRNAAAYTSLKPGELPSFQQQKLASGFSLTSNGTNGTNLTKTSLLQQNKQQLQQQQSNSANNSNSSTPTATSPIPQSDTLSKINTISELPEEQFINPSTTSIETNNTTSTNNNSNFNLVNQTNQLTEQLNQQLNLQQQQQYTTNLTNINNQSQDNWAQFYTNAPGIGLIQQQQQQPSVFNTPVTPTAAINNQMNHQMQTPPPLPPIPAQYLTNTPLMYHQLTSLNNGGYGYPGQTVPLASHIQMQLISQSQSTTAQTTTPTSSLIYTSPALLLSSPSSTQMQMAPNQNETFEQKWARLQAAKNTNPFAEDIAKKYEIKL